MSEPIYNNTNTNNTVLPINENNHLNFYHCFQVSKSSAGESYEYLLIFSPIWHEWDWRAS